MSGSSTTKLAGRRPLVVVIIDPMDPEVLSTEEPGHALATASAFLATDPVRHNVILTILHRRTACPEPGRYWVVLLGGEPVGCVVQSPLHFPATLTPMPDAAIDAVVRSIVDAGIALPGVNGDAATAARFAGQWTERNKGAAHPVQGQRIYQVRCVTAPAPIRGQLRRATSIDQELLVTWYHNFDDEIGESPRDNLAQVVERRLAGGEMWLWDDGVATALAGLSVPVAGVVRVGPVYTPPEHRNRGFASSCVAAVSEHALSQELRCILYTDLGNPTSNTIYRSLGYAAVAEGLRYRFA